MYWCAAAGESFSKEELLKEIWPDSFVEEANLSQHIFKLRKALGDTLEGERYIVTLPGPRLSIRKYQSAKSPRVAKR